MDLLNKDAVEALVNETTKKWLDSNQNTIRQEFSDIKEYAEDSKKRLKEKEDELINSIKVDTEKKKEQIEKKLNRSLIGLIAISVLLFAGISGTILFNTISKTQDSTLKLYDKIENFNKAVDDSKKKLKTSLDNIQLKSDKLDSLNILYEQKVDSLNILIIDAKREIETIEDFRKKQTSANNKGS